MKTLWTVLGKEMRESLRDRRSISAALIFALIGPLAIAMALNLLARREGTDRPLRLAVAGGGNAPALRSYLQQRGIGLTEAPADPVGAVRTGASDLAVRVPADFAERFRQGRPATVEIIHDGSRVGSRTDLRRARELIAGYSHEVASARLLARGISPESASPIRIEEKDLSTPRSRAAVALDMLPIFLLMAAFVGGMNVAIDVTAGERERGSLEALLAVSEPGPAVAAGKWLAASVFGVAGVIVCLVVSSLILNRLPLTGLALRVGITPAETAALLAILAPLALLATALQMLLATFSRSFKEAQTHLSMLLFAPMLPGFMTAFAGFAPPAWTALVPVVGQQMLTAEILRGGAGTGTLIGGALGGAASLAAAAGCVVATARLLRHERIVLGR